MLSRLTVTRQRANGMQQSTSLSKYYPDKEIIVVVYYFDYAADEDTATMKNIVSEIGGKKGVYISPDALKTMTVEKAEELDGEGDISFFCRLFFHSVTHDVSDSPLGGGAGVAGWMRAVMLPLLESAFTVKFDEMGIRGEGEKEGDAKKGAAHEFFKGGAGRFEWYHGVVKSVEGGKQALLGKLKEVGFLDVALDIAHEPRATMAWASYEKNAARPFDAAKVLITKVLLGVAGRDDSDDFVRDTMPKPPPKGPFKPETYTDDDVEEGLVVLGETASGYENSTDHVIEMVDTNELIMERQRTTMVDWLMDREVTNIAGEKCQWTPLYEYLRVVVMFLDKGDKVLRLLFVNRPRCYMMYAGSYATASGPTVGEVATQAICAQESQFIMAMLSIFRSEDSDGQITCHKTIWDNPAMAFMTGSYMEHNAHGYKKAINPLSKSLLEGRHLFEGKSGEGRNRMDHHFHRMPASAKGLTIGAQSRGGENTGYDGPPLRRRFNSLCAEGTEGLVNALPTDTAQERERAFRRFGHYFFNHESASVREQKRECEEMLQNRKDNEQTVARASGQTATRNRNEAKKRARDERVEKARQEAAEREEAKKHRG